MQISFEQEDVEKAIALYLRSMGITAKVAKVSFVAGRKDSGLRTTIDLESVQHSEIPEQPLKREFLNSNVGESTMDDGPTDPVDPPEQRSDAPDQGEDENESPLPDGDDAKKEDSEPGSLFGGS